MKHGKICPKCGSTEILVLKGSLWKDGVFLPAGFMLSPVPLSRRICALCGYVESWIENQTDIKRLEDHHPKDEEGESK